MSLETMRMASDAGITASSFSAVRSQVVGVVRSPLGFFTLALLIVEGFLVGAGALFNLPVEVRIIELAVGVFLFLFVVCMVCWLVVKHPTNLVFSERSHIQFAEMQIYGTSSHAVTGVALSAVAPEAPPLPPGTQLASSAESK